MLLIALAILVVIIGFVIFTYNALIAIIESVRNNQKQIDVQLDRRFKVFESLIEVLKKYMDYEKSVLSDVTALRSQSQEAKAKGNLAGQMAAENRISGILGGINAVFEQYPDLKANQNAMQLQEEIVSTENKLAFAKQAFNDSIEKYNATKKSFPTNIVVSAFSSKLDFDYPYWSLGSEDDVKAKDNYTVKL
ncbi:MAG: LemA family protein [Gammaproteobacteria bacterium]|nr:LemA family protein [Gammaproteobacteria bacterium]